MGTASDEAFGATRSSSGASSLFGFTGEPTDATGLVYLRARTLDPVTGRFLSADSVIPNATGTSGYNLYAYAGNDPTTWTDPTGHFVLTDPAFREAVKHVAGILLTYGVGAVGGVATVLRTILAASPSVVTALAVVIVAIVVIVAVFWVVSMLAEGVHEPVGSGEGTTGSSPEELEDARSSPQVPVPPIPPIPTALDPFPQADKKFREHGGRLGLSTLEEYIREAVAIAGGSISGGRGPGRGESCKAHGGTIYIWDHITGGIVVVSPQGFIVTYFRPDRGIAYWREQCEK